MHRARLPLFKEHFFYPEQRGNRLGIRNVAVAYSAKRLVQRHRQHIDELAVIEILIPVHFQSACQKNLDALIRIADARMHDPKMPPLGGGQSGFFP